MCACRVQGSILQNFVTLWPTCVVLGQMEATSWSSLGSTVLLRRPSKLVPIRQWTCCHFKLLQTRHPKLVLNCADYSPQENMMSTSVGIKSWPCLPLMNLWLPPTTKTTHSTVFPKPAAFFLWRHPRNFQNKTLVAHQKMHFRVFWSVFFHAQFLPKELFNYTSNHSPGQSRQTTSVFQKKHDKRHQFPKKHMSCQNSIMNTFCLITLCLSISVIVSVFPCLCPFVSVFLSEEWWCEF